MALGVRGIPTRRPSGWVVTVSRLEQLQRPPTQSRGLFCSPSQTRLKAEHIPTIPGVSRLMARTVTVSCFVQKTHEIRTNLPGAVDQSLVACPEFGPQPLG